MDTKEMLKILLLVNGGFLLVALIGIFATVGPHLFNDGWIGMGIVGLVLTNFIAGVVLAVIKVFKKDTKVAEQ